ncbi:MAG: hypothetical protein PHW03_04760 [Eubacteriales bacterium]|nr:hypothetical protein [Eubacteriales bacterium]MDD4390094.1 hypothetical protein [Eubacteriales bacterium]
MNETISKDIIAEDGTITVSEKDIIAVNLAMKERSETQVFDVGDLYMHSTGCIVNLEVKIKDVHPNKRAALGIILTEIDKDGKEHSRGVKTFTVPAHSEASCCDIVVKNIKFALPDDLNASREESQKSCCRRNLRVRTVVHHIDGECSVNG